MTILAVDYGKVRSGLAISDPGETLASPVCVIEERDSQRLAVRIAQQAKERGAQQIVLGLPRNMDGTEGKSAQNVRQFQQLLQQAAGLEVVLRDERGTTITAHGYLNVTNTRGKKRKAVVDSVAAVIILQDYLDYRRNRG